MVSKIKLVPTFIKIETARTIKNIKGSIHEDEVSNNIPKIITIATPIIIGI